jgi:sporulation protein YlmC with PRC-barrel domain
MTPTAIDLGLGVLDHQLIDSEGRRCGKVDELELEGVAEGSPRVAAIVVGAPAWRTRGLLGRLAARLVGGRTVLVPWEEVAEVDSGVTLRRTAAELRLGSGDDRTRPLVERIPGAGL